MKPVQRYYKYEIIEIKDEFDTIKSYLCAVKLNNELVGTPFEANTIEQAFAWLRLMIGGYPGTGFNDDDNTQVAVA